MLTAIFAVLFAFAVGVVACFFGYRVFLVLLPVWGFFAGLWLGAEAFQALFGEGFLATTTSWVVGLVLGVIFAVFAWLFYLLGVALLAAVIGYAIGVGLMQTVGFNTGFLIVLVGLIVGVAVAFVTLRYNLQKYVIMVLTAIAGGFAIALSALLLFGQVTVQEVTAAGGVIPPVLHSGPIWGLIALVIAAAGIYIQLRTSLQFQHSPDALVRYWG
ncbi:MAG: DUF4203 domain-containing protein [Anaerolineae bacterium]